MNCREIRAAIEATVRRGELAPSADKHLAICADCHQYANELYQLISLLAAQPSVEAPPDFDFQLRARLAREREKQRKFARISATLWSQPFSWGQATAALAVLAIAVTSATFYLAHRSDIQLNGQDIASQSTPGTDTIKQLPMHMPLAEKSGAVPPENTLILSKQVQAINGSPHVQTMPFATSAMTVTPIKGTEEITGTQEILIYRPGASRSLIIPRRGQAWGAQLVSVQQTAPPQTIIETF